MVGPRSPSPWARGLRSPSPAVSPTPPPRPRSRLAGVAGGTEPELNVAVAGLVDLLTKGLGEISAPAKSFSDSDGDLKDGASDAETTTPRTQSPCEGSVRRSGAPSRASIDSPSREVWSTEPCLFQPPSPSPEAGVYAPTPELGPEFLAELEETARTNAEIAAVWESLSEKIGRCNRCLGDLQNVGKDGKHRFEISAEEMAALRQGHYDHNVDDRGLTFREFVQRRGFQVSASCVDRLLGQFQTKVTASHLKRILKGRNKATARITENQLVASEHRAARNEPRADAVVKVQQRLQGLIRTRERCIRNLGRRKALAIELVGVPQSGRRALEAELQKVRARKRQLNEAGDSLAAHAQRKREEQLVAKIREESAGRTPKATPSPKTAPGEPGSPGAVPAASDTALQLAIADVERRARMAMAEFRDLARVGVNWPEQPAAILERLDDKMQHLVKRRRDMAAQMIRLKKQIWKGHCKWKRATREAKTSRPFSVAELQEERQSLREKLASISMVSLLRQWQRYKAERLSAMTDYRAEKSQLRPHFEAALLRWRSGASKNPFKRFMLEETLQGTTTGLNSRNPGVSGGPAEDLVSQSLLQERERKLDNKQKPLGARWRMLRAQHLSYYRFLKSHLRHLQKADFLTPVLVLLGTMRQETDQALVDSEGSLQEMKVAIQDDKQRMVQAMQAAVMHLTGKKTVERRGKKFEHYLLECAKHVEREVEFIASLQLVEGLQPQVEEAYVELVAITQLRPFPVAITVHQRVRLAEGAEAQAGVQPAIEKEEEDEPVQRIASLASTRSARSAFVGQKPITQTAFSVEEVEDKTSQVSGYSRRIPSKQTAQQASSDDSDDNSELPAEEEFTMERLTASVKATTAAASFLRKTVLPWTMLLEKREEVVHRLKQSRAYFCSARNTAMSLERRRFVADLSSNELIRRKFFVKCRATFEQIRADFRQNRLDPAKASLAANNAQATELDAQVRQLKAEAADLQHELSRIRMEVTAVEEVIQERPRQQMKHDLVDEAAKNTQRLLKDAKHDIVQLYTDISVTGELQRRIREKIAALVKCMCRLDKQETRRLVEGDKALASFKEKVQGQAAKSKLSKAELTHALQSLEAAIQGVDPGASSSSGSEDSQGRPRKTVTKVRTQQRETVHHPLRETAQHHQRETVHQMPGRSKGPSLNARALAWVGRQIRKKRSGGQPVGKELSQGRGRRTAVGIRSVKANAQGTRESRLEELISGQDQQEEEEPEVRRLSTIRSNSKTSATARGRGDSQDRRSSALALDDELQDQDQSSRQDSSLGGGTRDPSKELRRPSKDSRRPSKEVRRPSKDLRRPSKESRRPSKAPSIGRSSRGPPSSGAKDPAPRRTVREDNLQEARDVAAAVAQNVREQDQKRKKASKRLKNLWAWAKENLQQDDLKEFTSMPEFQEIAQMEERERAAEAENKLREQKELELVLTQMAEARKQVAARLEQTRIELQRHVKEDPQQREPTGGAAQAEAEAEADAEAATVAAAAADGGAPTHEERKSPEGGKNPVLEVVEGLLANSADFEAEEVAFSLNKLGMTIEGGELDQQVIELREAEIREQEAEIREQEQRASSVGRVSSQDVGGDGSAVSDGSELDGWEPRESEASETAPESRRESHMGPRNSETPGTGRELIEDVEAEEELDESQGVRRSSSRPSQRQLRQETALSMDSDDEEAAIAATLGDQTASLGVTGEVGSGQSMSQEAADGRTEVTEGTRSAAQQQLQLRQQELPISSVPSTRSMTGVRSLIPSPAPDSNARHRVALSVIVPNAASHVSYVTPPSTNAFPPSAPARAPRKASKGRKPVPTSALQITPGSLAVRSPSPSPTPSDAGSEAAAAALAVTNVTLHARLVSKESASCVDELEFPSRMGTKETLSLSKQVTAEAEEIIGRQSSKASQEHEGPLQRRVLRMVKPHLLFEIPSESSFGQKADLSLTALAGPRPARPALPRRQATAGQDSALLDLPSAPVQVKPLLRRQAQDQPDGVYAGLKVFVHEFQDERGVMVESRVDYFVRRPVPGENCWWRLQELQEEFWGANGCCTVTMRWRPQHPVSHHTENCFCIIRKASFPDPGLLRLTFVAFAGEGEDPLPEPEAALLSWSGGGTRPVRVEEIKRQKQVNEVLEGHLVYEIRSSSGELRFTLGEGFEPVALAAPLHLSSSSPSSSSSPAAAKTKANANTIAGLVDLKSMLRQALRRRSGPKPQDFPVRQSKRRSERRLTMSSEDFASRTAQRAEARALSLRGEQPAIERQQQRL